MATRSSTTTAGPLTPDAGPATPVRRADRSLPALLLALLAVAAVFVTTAVRVLSGMDESFRYGGDQAMAGLAVDEASALERQLGPYSRYGWSHPGPLWFYLLAPATRLLGGDDAALTAANVLVNGLLAVAVVVVVHRTRSAALTLAVTGLLLVFLLRMPADMFLDVWSPFALLLGTLLFLVLAARAHSGTWPALLAVLIAGSFLVQTHVGSAPLVVLVSATGLVAFVLARRAHRGAVDPGAAAAGTPWLRQHGRTAALAAVLVAVWLPPVVQQLSSPLREGNIVRLVDFFLQHEDGTRPTLPQAVVAVGRLLAMTPYDQDPGPWQMDVDGLPVSVALVLAAQVLASVGLVVLGRRRRSRSGLWWGVVTLVALASAIVSAATVTGDLYWYLVIWVSVLPAATAIGYAHLLLDGRTGTDRTPVVAALAVVVLAGTVAAAMTLGDAVEDLPASPEVAVASDLLDDALADVDARSVHVDITPHGLWPVGAGVIRDLVSDGRTVTVDPRFTDLFGTRRAQADGGPVEVLLVATGSPAYERLTAEADVTALGDIPSRFGRVSLLLRVER